MGTMRVVSIVSRWQAISQVRYFTIFGPHILKFASFLKSTCRDQVKEFPENFCITLYMGMMGSLHYTMRTLSS